MRLTSLQRPNRKLSPARVARQLVVSTGDAALTTLLDGNILADGFYINAVEDNLAVSSDDKKIEN